MGALNFQALQVSPSLPAFGMPMLAGFVALLLFGMAYIGYVTGKQGRDKAVARGEEPDTGSGETTLGAILALLGLLLAFSFGNALSLAESRKSDIIQEANTLGTAFLRADLLPEPGRTDLKEVLLSYAETRVLPERPGLTTEEAALGFLATTLEAQSLLWPTFLEASQEPVPAAVRTFVAASVNEILDAHLIRMRSVAVPVAELSQAIVVLTALAALFVIGNRSGASGQALTWRTLLFAALLFVVIMTIIDLQRATQGFLVVDQTALLTTITEMRAALE